MLAVHITMTALFLALGLLFRQGKGAFLLSPCLAVSRKKRRAQERVRCRQAGARCLALALAWAILALGMLWSRDWLFWLGLTLFCCGVVSGAVAEEQAKN